MTSSADLRKLTNKKLAEYRAAQIAYRAAAQDLDESQKELEATIEAQDLAQRVAEEVQKQAHDQIASVVSRCLDTVFDEPYEFKILFERKRGRTEARLVFERDGMEVDPMTASGGGAVDVAAFALRISCLMLSQPPLRRTIIMDEPFKFVSESKGYRERVRLLLETLSEEMNIQFIMVTHMEELKTGQVIELG